MTPSHAIRVACPLLYGLAFLAAACSAPATVVTARETPLRIASYNIRHGRGSDDLLNWMRRGVESGEVLPTIPDYAIDMHTGAEAEVVYPGENVTGVVEGVAPKTTVPLMV